MEEPIEHTEQEQMSSVEQDPYQTLQDHYHILLSLYRILEKDQQKLQNQYQTLQDHYHVEQEREQALHDYFQALQDHYQNVQDYQEALQDHHQIVLDQYQKKDTPGQWLVLELGILYLI